MERGKKGLFFKLWDGYVLKNKYGEIDLATFPKTIKDLCGYLQCQKPQEQSDYLERLKKMGEVCQEFAEDALKDIKQPLP